MVIFTKSTKEEKRGWKKLDKEIDKLNKELKDWITKVYGKKCRTSYKGCRVCQAWKLYGELKIPK